MAAEKVVSVRLRAITDQFKSGMDQASASVRGFANDADRVQQAGARMKNAGRSMTVGLTLPIVAAGVAAVKTAVNFDTSMSRIQGLVGLSADEVSGMRDRVLELSGSTTKAPQELADALFAITSAGLRGSEALTLLEDAGKASAAGLGDTRQIALTATAAMRTFGLTSAEAVDIMVGAVREGNLSAEEMAGAFGKVVQIGGAAGVKFEEIAGLTAFLTRGNVTASEATTQLEQAILALNSPTQEAAASLEAAGGSVEGLQAALQSGGIVGALQYLEDALEGDDLAMRKALGSSEALAAAQTILGDESGDLREILDGVADSAGAGADAFDAYADSDGFDAAQAWAELQTSLIELGQQLIPVLSMGADMLSSFASAFSNLPSAAQTGVIAFLALVAVTGPMLSAIGSLMVAFPGLATAAMAMATRVRGAMIVMSGGHPLLLGFVAAVTVAMGAMALFGDSSQGASADVKALSDAIGTQNGLIGENTTAWLKNKLVGQDSSEAGQGIARAMESAGLSIEDMNEALAAGGEEWEVFMARVVGAGADSLDEIKQLGQIGDDFIDADALSKTADAIDGVGDAAEGTRPGMEAGAEAAAAMAEEQMVAAQAAQELEAALAPLNVALSKSDAAIAARDAMRSLGDAYAEATEDGQITAEEMDNLTGSLNDLTGRLAAAAEANHTLADGSVDGAAATAELRASLEAVRSMIPAELLPAFDAYIATIEEVPDRADVAMGTPGSERAKTELYGVELRARNIPPTASIHVTADTSQAIRAFRDLEAAASAAAAAARTSPSALGFTGSANPLAQAAGGIHRARRGGRLLRVAEAGFDEVVLSTDPKYQKRNVGLLEASGLMRSLMTPVTAAPRPAGGSGGAGMSPAAFGAAVRTAVSGMTVVMDREVVGRVVTKQQLSNVKAGR